MEIIGRLQIGGPEVARYFQAVLSSVNQDRHLVSSYPRQISLTPVKKSLGESAAMVTSQACLRQRV
jgi:hypothetical protein